MLVTRFRRRTQKHQTSRHLAKKNVAKKATKNNNIVFGGAGPELLNENYSQLINKQRQSYPHKEFITSIHESQRWSYETGSKFIDAFASGIHTDGAFKGSTWTTAVGVRLENFMSQVSAGRANKRYAALDVGLVGEPFLKQLQKSKAGTLIWPPKYHNTNQLNHIYDLFPQIKTCDQGTPFHDLRVPSLRLILQNSRLVLQGLGIVRDIFLHHNDDGIRKEQKNINVKEPLTLVFNNEGNAVELCQHNIINTGYLVGLKAGITSEDYIHTTVPFQLSAGLSLGAGLLLAARVCLEYVHEIYY
eukprot:TRINITY_DN274_c0_g1_i1.p1 TRINITY_DN274_c0_g1~~TRINITY_DN274_c0_g1_i1.p1  ORF type:complete len:302 (-),score=60.39 TRINITY_DN274_c0_g1_i1:559-1464(-)